MHKHSFSRFLPYLFVTAGFFYASVQFDSAIAQDANSPVPTAKTSAIAPTDVWTRDYVLPDISNMLQIASAPVLTVPQGGPIAARPRREGLYDTEAYVSPPSSYFGNSFGLSAGRLSLDYAHFSPSSGSDGNQWGFSGTGLFPLGKNFGLNLDLGYHNVSSTGASLDNWTVNGSLAWLQKDWRIGPSFGYQSNSVGSFSTSTYNYGLFADYFASPSWTLSGKGGGFSSSPGSDGYYLGGQLKGYLNPDFALSGSIDYTRFTRFGGSSETDYTFAGEYLFWDDEDEDDDDCWWPPSSIYGGYTYSGFAPGKFYVNSFFIGLKLYTNGNGADSLVDRQRTGTLDNWNNFAALSLKF